jgi:antitoxin component of RelBE/YafQ-DinJ toxin-antitoxin module
MKKEKTGSVRSFYIDDKVYGEFEQLCKELGINTLSPVVTALLQYFISKQKELRND